MEMMVAEPTIASSSSQSILSVNSNNIKNHLMKHIDHYDDDVTDKNNNDYIKKKQVEMVKKELNERTDVDGEGVDDNDMDVSIHNRDGDECDDYHERVSVYHIYHYLSNATNYYIHLSYILILYLSYVSINHIYPINLSIHLSYPSIISIYHFHLLYIRSSVRYIHQFYLSRQSYQIHIYQFIYVSYLPIYLPYLSIYLYI
jgi:hypothetical protein